MGLDTLSIFLINNLESKFELILLSKFDGLRLLRS